jgi:hypothetical protein
VPGLPFDHADCLFDPRIASSVLKCVTGPWPILHAHFIASHQSIHEEGVTYPRFQRFLGAVTMVASQEYRVSTLAHRIGLQLTRMSGTDDVILYRLVEPSTMMPIYPGGGIEGAVLHEIEDWLSFPWE